MTDIAAPIEPLTIEDATALKELGQKAIRLAEVRAHAWAEATGTWIPGIESIYWYIEPEDGDVVGRSRYDDHCGEASIHIPLTVLALGDEAFATTAASVRQVRLDHDEAKAKARKEQEARLQDLNDRRNYERLKAKFEGKS